MRRRTSSRLTRTSLATLASLAVFWLLLPSSPAQSSRPIYARPVETARSPALLPLPPGAIEPAGWLRDWCLSARDGCTGHMDDVAPEFRHAWAADFQQRGTGLNWPNGAWPYEGGGYWFDGLTRLGLALHDESLLAQARTRFRPVLDRMNDRGFLFLWWLDRKSDSDRAALKAGGDGWSIWASGLMGRALSGYYAGTKDPHALEAMVKAYGPDPEGLRWINSNLSNVAPAFDAYTWSGDPGIRRALDNLFHTPPSGFSPNIARFHAPPDMTPGSVLDNCHVVEFLEGTTPWALGTLWTGDESYLKATLAWHDLLAKVSMLPTGAPVADEWFLPTGAFRGTETCDVAGYLWSQLFLLSLTGDGKLADRAERVFFNAGPATIARDFKTHVYFQSPNRFAAGSPSFPHGPGASGGNYAVKHMPLCCTAAVNRIVPWYVTNMWMATPDNGLAATCYGPCKVSALVADRVPVEIACTTDYPFTEDVEMTVKPTREVHFPISVHIPAWCERPALTINGAVVPLERSSTGFARIDRTWKPGDAIALSLPMAPKIEQGRDRAPRGPVGGEHLPSRITIRGEDDPTGAPFGSVSMGPLLFAEAIADVGGPNTPDPTATWKVALDTHAPGFEVVRTSLPSRWDWPLASPLKVRTRVFPVDWNPAPGSPTLPDAPIAPTAAARSIELIPYGCTKFRISMFPVARREPALKDVRKILFLGNSITHHGPNESLGWPGDWGMAASAPEKDYVHLVAAAVGRIAGKAPEFRDLNIADFERGYANYDAAAKLKDAIAFDADLIILAIGENVPALDSPAAGDRFETAVRTLLGTLQGGRDRIVLVRSCFWANGPKDERLSKASRSAGVRFVDIGRLGADPANAARSERAFKHEGVAGHPGDRGMKAIAEAIMEALK
ncbi:beta-L-arabinofuranosidase domain-containing protein [Aquisphaera insulae]|uniref:beta-L-arabinofuranosidase domain-containing protein n=1 Tax=Aquisphaera insulae TaxID=2712864 RepID=UPI0013EBE1FF|nr:beta-L-arabinofuranosidase domain-containing protein [Aquisphaera insulae]